jgi:hypothetical protein
MYLITLIITSDPVVGQRTEVQAFCVCHCYKEYYILMFILKHTLDGCHMSDVRVGSLY